VKPTHPKGKSMGRVIISETCLNVDQLILLATLSTTATEGRDEKPASSTHIINKCAHKEHDRRPDSGSEAARNACCQHTETEKTKPHDIGPLSYLF
jgi:hypothetical protein